MRSSREFTFDFPLPDFFIGKNDILGKNERQAKDFNINSSKRFHDDSKSYSVRESTGIEASSTLGNNRLSKGFKILSDEEKKKDLVEEEIRMSTYTYLENLKEDFTNNPVPTIKNVKIRKLNEDSDESKKNITQPIRDIENDLSIVDEINFEVQKHKKGKSVGLTKPFLNESQEKNTTSKLIDDSSPRAKEEQSESEQQRIRNNLSKIKSSLIPIGKVSEVQGQAEISNSSTLNLTNFNNKSASKDIVFQFPTSINESSTGTRKNQENINENRFKSGGKGGYKEASYLSYLKTSSTFKQRPVKDEELESVYNSKTKSKVKERYNPYEDPNQSSINFLFNDNNYFEYSENKFVLVSGFNPSLFRLVFKHFQDFGREGCIKNVFYIDGNDFMILEFSETNYSAMAVNSYDPFLLEDEEGGDTSLLTCDYLDQNANLNLKSSEILGLNHKEKRSTLRRSFLEINDTVKPKKTDWYNINYWLS